MGSYADVNGVRMYYEEHGSGEPLVLVHGGLAGAFIWQTQVADLSHTHHLFVPEMRGRARTADVQGAISYQVMADDLAVFLAQVVGAPAHFVGASDGGVVGLLLAMQHQDLLLRLVTIGSNFHRDGLVGASMWTGGSPDDPEWAMPRQRYEALSPNGPDHFPVVFAKLQRMWREEPTLSVGDLARISIPVLVIAGDDDVVQGAHTLDLYEALPHGQLGIIPGASHGVFMEKPGLLNRIILDFLAEQGDPVTMLPVRRGPAGR